MILINGQRHNIAFSNDKASRVDTGDWNSIATSLSNNPKLEWRWLYNNGVDIKDYGFSSSLRNSASNTNGAKYSTSFDTEIEVRGRYRCNLAFTISCPNNFRITYLKVNYNGYSSAYRGFAMIETPTSSIFLQQASYSAEKITEAIFEKPNKVDSLVLYANHSNEGNYNGTSHYCSIQELRGIFL